MPALNPFTFDNPYYSLGVESKLSVGVVGHARVETGKGIYVYTIRSSIEGKGYVRSYIDQLMEEHFAIRFPNVVNPKLAEILREKGFKKKREHVAQLKGHLDVWVWKRK